MEKKTRAKAPAKPKPKVVNFAKSYAKHLKGFSSAKTPDLEILINNEILKVHKIILASKNKVFKAILDSQMTESKKNCIEITDCDSAAFKAFLDYLYTSEMPSKDISLELLKIADKYLDVPLKKHCLEKLCNEVSLKNIAETGKVATQFNFQELITACQKFATDNYTKLLGTPQMDAILENKPLVTAIFKELSTSSKKHKFLLGGLNILLGACEFCGHCEVDYDPEEAYCCKASVYERGADRLTPNHSLTFFEDDIEWCLKVGESKEKKKKDVILGITLEAKNKKVVADVELSVLSGRVKSPNITFKKQYQSFGKQFYQVLPRNKLINNKIYVKRNEYFTVELSIKVLSVESKRAKGSAARPTTSRQMDFDSDSNSDSNADSGSDIDSRPYYGF